MKVKYKYDTSYVKLILYIINNNINKIKLHVHIIDDR